MTMSEDELLRTLALLRHGGEEAIVLFVKVARRMYDSGNTDDFDSWVAIASPALPEAERHAVIGILLRAFFREYELVEDERATIQ